MNLTWKKPLPMRAGLKHICRPRRHPPPPLSKVTFASVVQWGSGLAAGTAVWRLAGQTCPTQPWRWRSNQSERGRGPDADGRKGEGEERGGERGKHWRSISCPSPSSLSLSPSISFSSLPFTAHVSRASATAFRPSRASQGRARARESCLRTRRGARSTDIEKERARGKRS